MRLFNNLRIGTRLALAFSAAILFTLLIALFARQQLAHIDEELQLLLNDRVAKVKSLNSVIDNANEIGNSVRNLLLVSDMAAKAEELSHIDKARAGNDALFSSLEQSLVSAESRRLLAENARRRDPYTPRCRRSSNWA